MTRMPSELEPRRACHAQGRLSGYPRSVRTVTAPSGDSPATIASYPSIRLYVYRSADMCNHCHLVIPRGAHEVCHACAIALRAEIRRGLHAIEEYLGGWSQLERWLADQD